MKEVFIVAAARTPVGTWGGSLKDLSATQLGAVAIEKAVEKAGLAKEEVDEVLMGCVLQANLGQAPARQASKFAGLPDKVIATTINKVCSSGLKAVSYGAQSIMLGDADVVVAGGMESMSNVPFYNEAQRWGHKYGNVSLIDGIAKDGLQDVYHNYAMGCAAELCSRDYKISREDQDAYAVQSYERSQKAVNEGWFDEEIAPVSIKTRQGEVVISKDEEPFNVKFEKISGLRPAFEKEGTVTAANASTMNDGASALVLMSKEKMEALGIKPLAKITGFADAEKAPEHFTTAPTEAINKLLKKTGKTIGDVDFFEINEAFAVVSLANNELLKLNTDKVNVHGGAVSLGHPLGSSGSRILVTLLHVLKKNKGKIGVAGICNGGGGATAMMVEMM